MKLLRDQLAAAHSAELAKQHIDTYRAYEELAGYFFYSNNLGLAATFYRRCKQIAEEQQWVEGEMKANLKLGEALAGLHDLAGAQECHQRYLAAAEAVAAPADLASSSRLVQVYLDRAAEQQVAGDLDAGLETLRQGLHAAERLGDSAAAAQAHRNLGLACKQQGDMQAAVEHLEAYLASVGEEAGEEVGPVQCALADCQRAAGNVAGAVLSLEAFLEANPTAAPSAQALTCYSLGCIHYEAGRYDEAVLYLEKCYEVARALPGRRLLEAARVNLGAARAALQLGAYMQVVASDLPALLLWKNVRMPFHTEA